MNREFNQRDEDRRWRESLESKLKTIDSQLDELKSRTVSLTAAQTTTDSQLDDLEVEIAGFKEMMNGVPSERDGGLIGQVNLLESKVNFVRALLQPDQLNQGGLLNDFRELKAKVEGKWQAKEFRWHYLNTVTVALGSIIVGLISAMTLMVLNWDKVSALLNRRHQAIDPVEQMIENVKHPRSRHRHVHIVVTPPPETQSDEPQEPEGK